MRILSAKEDINYSDTQKFFDGRIKKYNKDNPYSLTMYQDKHPELVKARNRKEIEKLLPLLKLNETSRVLDVACGIGRWSDAIDNIEEYCGIDFCKAFVDIASERKKEENRYFFYANSVDLLKCLNENGHNSFNRFLLIGSLMYLNDEDVISTLNQIISVSNGHSIICIREPIGLEDRLTLKEQFSEELEDNYNAIYRTREQIVALLEVTLLKNGFNIMTEGFLFEEVELNNRKETAQYYYILER